MFFYAIKGRRSCRKFLPDAVSDDDKGGAI